MIDHHYFVSYQSIGNTSAESNMLQAIAYSNLGSVICTAAKDSLKVLNLCILSIVSIMRFSLHDRIVSYRAVRVDMGARSPVHPPAKLHRHRLGPHRRPHHIQQLPTDRRVLLL